MSRVQYNWNGYIGSAKNLTALWQRLRYSLSQ